MLLYPVKNCYVDNEELPVFVKLAIVFQYI